MELFRYFKQQNAWGLEVRTCGYQHVPPGVVYPPKGHPGKYMFKWEQGRVLPGFHIIYIPSGAGIFESEQIAPRKIHAGDVIFLHENEWHRYRPDEHTGWEEYWIGFDGEYFREHMRKDLYPGKCSIVKSIGYQDSIILLFEQILMMSKRTSPHLDKVLSGSVFNLLGLLISIKENAAPAMDKSDVVEQTIYYLRQHLNKPVDFEKLARQFGMSYSGYRKLFKSKTGDAINQFLIKERLSLAHRMIRNSSMPLQEISEKCGFESLHYFSRLFKMKMGIRPSDVRKVENLGNKK